MLQEEGLISKESRRGAFVAPIRPELVEEIRAIRIRIEPFAAQRVLSVPTNGGAVESGLRLTFTIDHDPERGPADLVESHRALFGYVQGDIVALRSELEAHLMSTSRIRPGPTDVRPRDGR